jgi:uncharacterized glyoxalase superfamily protein PhnB
MGGKVKAIPEGFHTVTPHLVVRGAAQAIEFYQRAFGAKAGRIHYGPDGKSITHADLKIGDSILMLSDEFPGMKDLAPPGGSRVTLHLYVEDVDELFNRAVAAGATVAMPLMDAFWGDRYGQLIDPFGHSWSLATHKQDLSEAEIQKAQEVFFAELAKQGQSGH